MAEEVREREMSRVDIELMEGAWAGMFEKRGGCRNFYFLYTEDRRSLLFATRADAKGSYRLALYSALRHLPLSCSPIMANTLIFCSLLEGKMVLICLAKLQYESGPRYLEYDLASRTCIYKTPVQDSQVEYKGHRLRLQLQLRTDKAGQDLQHRHQ